MFRIELSLFLIYFSSERDKARVNLYFCTCTSRRGEMIVDHIHYKMAFVVLCCVSITVTKFEESHSQPNNEQYCCKNISRTETMVIHRSENPGSPPSLLPRLDVTLLLRLDLSESVRLLCAEAAAVCSSLDLLLDRLPPPPPDDVELGGRSSSDEEGVAAFSSTWNLAVTVVVTCCVGVAHREDWQLGAAVTPAAPAAGTVVVVVVSTTTWGSTNRLAVPPPFNELCVDGGSWLELM